MGQARWDYPQHGGARRNAFLVVVEYRLRSEGFCEAGSGEGGSMTHTAKQDEQLWVFSMGKRFRVRAITDSMDEANGFMERHNETALIACFGPFNVIANCYEGIRDTDRL